MKKNQIKDNKINDFLFIAGHDLLSPIRKIEEFSALLEASENEHLSVQGKDYLIRMRHSVRKMRSFIEALLKYSEITHKDISCENCDLELICKNVIQAFEDSINEYKIKIEIDSLPAIKGDSFLLQILFHNLFSNAIKFRSHHPLVIQITGHLNELEYEISFNDNGIGFETHLADQLFNPFQRLHKNLKIEGIGLGLSFCKQVVEKHGGSIKAQSRQSGGASFIIKLPIK